MKEAIVKDQVEIKAPIDKVWNVLTQTKYYKQWDELPEGFTAEELSEGAVIDWEGHAKLTVVVCQKNEELKLSLELPKVDMEPSEYDISYTFLLTEKDGETQLNFVIGDFAPLPDAKSYYDASVEFAETAKNKIKALAEQK